MRVSRLRLVVAGAVLALSLPAGAGNDHKIVQKDFSFSEKEVRVHVGDKVVFVNADPVPHNVYSLSKGQEFEIRSQMPGQADPVPFNRPGTAEVRCAIHPKMKMMVHVAQ